MRKQGHTARGWVSAGLAVGFVGVGCLALARLPAAQADGGAPSTPVAHGSVDTPVLVELFTSEGCSSCPAAEDALTRLAASQPVTGARIVPIAFHVDYWDRLGWTDPFSSPIWTARQGDYARGRGGNLYTPEAVVQGGSDCVGSDDAALQGLVRAAAAGATTRVDLTAVFASEGTLRVDVHVGPSEEAAQLFLVLTESHVSVAVPRGENGGRTLQHAAIARDLKPLGLVPAAGGQFTGTLDVPRTSQRDQLAVVAFVQNGRGGRIAGVGTVKP